MLLTLSRVRYIHVIQIYRGGVSISRCTINLDFEKDQMIQMRFTLIAYSPLSTDHLNHL